MLFSLLEDVSGLGKQSVKVHLQEILFTRFHLVMTLTYTGITMFRIHEEFLIGMFLKSVTTNKQC